MVTIPNQPDPTLQAMLKLVAERPRENRDYLGASLIGESCARKIWYKFNRFPEEKSQWADIANCATDSGHWAEKITADRLKQVPGIELHTHQPDGSQYGWSAFEGKFKGHVDGLIRGLLQAPKAPHVWEHKDKDHKKFSDFQSVKEKHGEKDTLRNWNEIYYAQAQVNMHYFQIDRHYMTVSYAGARKYDSCRTEYNGADAEKYIDRAYKIINTDAPPPRISENPDFFKCKICPYRNVKYAHIAMECHG